MAKVKREIDEQSERLNDGLITPDPYTQDGQQDAVARIMADGWHDEIHMFCRYFRGPRLLVLDWDGDYRVGLYHDTTMDQLVAMVTSHDLEVLLNIVRGLVTTLPPEYTAAELAILRKYRHPENPRSEALYKAGEQLVQEAAERVRRAMAGRYSELDRQLHVANEHAEHGGIDECPVCQAEAEYQTVAPKGTKP